MDPLEQKPITPENSFGTTHKNGAAPIRTYNSDLAQAIREKGGSVVRVAIAENEKHEQELMEQSIKSKKNLAFTIGGMVLIVTTLGFAGWSYLHNKNAAIVPAVETKMPSSLVSADTYEIINASGMQIPELIAAVKASAVDPRIEQGDLKNIIVAEGAATRMPAAKFLSVIKTHAPAGFTQAILPDFMIGSYKYEAGELFIIVHGTAHDFLLAGMLNWEPYLFNDMSDLFAVDTSSFTRAELQSLPFKDTIIANRDARAVTDKDGKPVFFYSFLDPNTIIFSADPKTLAEVVRRM